MKIIFLDIDGVLNSEIYDRQRKDSDSNIDVSRLALVKELVDKSGAKIVLSSSWRGHWDRDKEKMTAVGRELDSVFSDAGLEIFDKTPVLSSRSEEIGNWLSNHPEAEKFVIFDDMIFGWGELASRLVRTDARIGRGLERTHIDMAYTLLTK